MGEGAAVLVLEELEAARARGATIYAEVLGYGASNDAHHMLQPDPEAGGVVAMMRAAFQRAGVAPDQVDYINAHGTGRRSATSPRRRRSRRSSGPCLRARHLFTKSMLGHMFGAAGAIEAVACALAIHEGTIPPTINYEHPDPDLDLDYVPNEARGRGARGALERDGPRRPQRLRPSRTSRVAPSSLPVQVAQVQQGLHTRLFS